LSVQQTSIVPDSNFTPSTKSKQIKVSKTGDWFDFEEPLIISIVGMRSGGKSGMSDYMLQKYYDQHFTILHLYSARSLENLYPIVNKNCGHHFDKIKQLIKNKFEKDYTKRPFRLLPNEEETYTKIAIDGGFIKKTPDDRIVITQKGADLVNNKLLHCSCRKALPVLLCVPDYIDFKEDTVLRFNGAYWKDFDEYKQYNSEITTQQKELLLAGNLLKPAYLRPEPLLKVRQFVVPTTEIRIMKFRVEWTESVLQARKEHRILVMSPLFFEGADKFVTLAEIASYHAILMNMSGHFEKPTEKSVGKPKKYWTLKQKNSDKIALFIDEARSVIPSSKMHGEAGAGKSKRALFDKVPEMRHFKTWLFLFYQNPMDVYDGVRNQGNMTVMKRSHIQLAGAEWKWIFDRVERDRFGFAKKILNRQIEKIEQLKMFENRYPKLKKYIDERRPRIEKLSTDKAYVIRYGTIRLIKNGMGSWHHKQEMDSIRGDTGLEWTVNREKRPEETTKTKTEVNKEKKQMKAIKEDIFKRMKYARETEQKEWVDVAKDLVQCQEDGIIPDMKYAGKDGDYFSNLYNRWKKKFESTPT